jgi:hypothetical protein
MKREIGRQCEPAVQLLPAIGNFYHQWILVDMTFDAHSICHAGTAPYPRSLGRAAAYSSRPAAERIMRTVGALRQP